MTENDEIEIADVQKARDIRLRSVCKPAVAEKANALLLVHMSPESGRSACMRQLINTRMIRTANPALSRMAPIL